MPSHPSRVRELKREDEVQKYLYSGSHPSRVRELKLERYNLFSLYDGSHPSRVRELKHFFTLNSILGQRRTPPGCVN